MALQGNFPVYLFIPVEEQCFVQFYIFAKPERGVLIVVRNFKVDQTRKNDNTNKNKNEKQRVGIVKKKVKSDPLFQLHAEIYIAQCLPLGHGEVT